MATGTVITTVQGSAAEPYEIRLGGDGNVYCTCPSWKFQKLPPKERTCKHMKALSGQIAAFTGKLAAKTAAKAPAAPVAAPKAAAPVVASPPAPAPVVEAPKAAVVAAPVVNPKVAVAQAKVAAAKAALALAQAEVELAEALAA
jgi:hypothetical protein